MTALRSLLLALLATGIAAPAAAQTDRAYPFRAGYVVTTAGDTLRGQIQDQTAFEHAWGAYYRPAAGGDVTTYGPKDALGYGFDGGRRYVRRTVHPSLDTLHTETAFLRVVVQGPLNLYRYDQNSGATLYFVEGEGFSLAGLYDIRERVPRSATGNAGWRIRRQRLYVGTLRVAFGECRDAARGLDSVPYTQGALTRAVIQYNRCEDPSFDHEQMGAEARGALAFHPVVWLGVGHDRLTTLQGGLTGTALLAGVYLDVEILRLAPRYSLLAGLTYRRHDVPYRGYRSGYFRAGALIVNLGLRYEHPFRFASPYAAVSYLSGPIIGSSPRIEDPSSPAVFSRQTTREVSEGGFLLDVGLVRPLTSGADLVGGVRYERTASSSGFIYVPGAYARHTRQITSFHLGVRF